MRFLVAAFIASLAMVEATAHHNKHHNNKHATHAPSEKELETMFTQFVKTHHKKYTHDEFFHRFNTFKANLEIIRTHNSGNHTYTLGVNEYADLTWQEFKSARLGFKPRDNGLLRSKNVAKLHQVKAAASVDWRQKGAVTAVKNQGQCGSCWSFSTTGSVEAAHFLAGNSLVSLSEQQLVDCSTAQGNQGCNGGLMDDAFQYIISNGGITTEANYPYQGVQGTCQSGLSVAATISSFKDVTAGDENALLTAVNIQPISVAIEADQESFQLYSGGVLTAACGTNLDHGVLVVGYGTDNGQDYWIVKNSWGATWGEQGYIRLARGINQCGISNQPSYPIV